MLKMIYESENSKNARPSRPLKNYLIRERKKFDAVDGINIPVPVFTVIATKNF